MRIGIDCRIFSSRYTGIGRYTFEMVRHLAKINEHLKFPHEFILFMRKDEFENFTPPPCAKKILADIGHYSIAEQLKFPGIIQKENPDIMFFPHFNVPVLYRGPFIVTIHDLTLHFFPKRDFKGKINKFFYQIVIKSAVRRARKVIAISENTKNDIIKYLKISSQKIAVIYNGVGEEFTITNEKSPFDKEFLLYTGVWRYHKNLVGLLNAFLIVSGKIDARLVITGKPDPQYPEVKETVKNLGLEDKVIFTGHVDEKELVRLYNCAKIYVFPSFYEGFGLPPLEAMKCGTPVVASNTSSIPEICGQNNALFFDPYDINDIAQKIEKLWTDADLQAELIKKGMSHAAKFTWQSAAERVYNLLK